ncbi:MAG: rRNA pseudouridine synthase, partial [Candidatus Omnitrophica bacterium]|nr:rRNA pseudouridine synthase [Candidatus Omnitrophota bacterium]
VVFKNKPVIGNDYQYILLHKPAGYTTTKEDRFALKTVYDLLPEEFQMLSPAGRLDKETEGLLLLSNDGDFVYRLTHPKFNFAKKYIVEISGQLDKDHQMKLQSGIVIEGKKTYPAEIRNVKFSKDRTQLEIIIHEGRKRQIRLMFAKFRYKVIYLKRLAQGAIRLGNLKKGSWRLLTKEEVAAIKKTA